MTIKLPETIAEVLNNAEDAAEMAAFNRLVLRSKDVWKRHPADVAFMLKKHFTMEEIFTTWAVPYTRVDKEGKMFDFRDRVITETNEIPFFDTSYSKIDNALVKNVYYRRFVERLAVGSELASTWETLKKVKAGPEVYDLNSINTMVTIETRTLGADGTSNTVHKDARDIDGADLPGYISDLNKQLNDFANGYRDAVVLLRQWHEINTRAEFKGQVELDWNWADPRDPSAGLHRNGAPFKLYAISMVTLEGFDKPVPQRSTWTAITWERLYGFDLDKAAAAIAAPDSKVGAYRAILENKYKKPDNNAAGAGQGATADAKRKSPIKVTGDGNMNDVLDASVLFWVDDGTVTAWKHFVYQGMDGGQRDDVWYNIVELRDLLDKVVTNDMEAGHQRVVEATKAREKAERDARAKREAENAQAERQPTQADIWRAKEKARQDEALKVLAPSKPQAENTSTPGAVPASTPAEQPKPATSGRTRAGGTRGRQRAN